MQICKYCVRSKVHSFFQVWTATVFYSKYKFQIFQQCACGNYYCNIVIYYKHVCWESITWNYIQCFGNQTPQRFETLLVQIMLPCLNKYFQPSLIASHVELWRTNCWGAFREYIITISLQFLVITHYKNLLKAIFGCIVKCKTKQNLSLLCHSSMRKVTRDDFLFAKFFSKKCIVPSNTMRVWCHLIYYGKRFPSGGWINNASIRLW